MGVDPGDGLVTLLSGLGLKLVNLVVGAVASFCALRFFDGLTKADKWSTFIGGWALASWGANPLAEFMELPPKVEIGIVLLLGFFGMALAAELIKLIKSTDWGALLREAFESILRWIRRDRP